MSTDRRTIVVVVIALACSGGVLGDASAQAKRAAARSQILGAWELESRTVRTDRGEVLLDPMLGKQPLGRLFYDASGHMMLQLMRQARAQAISTPSNPQEAKNPRIVLGYDAYFGTFQVNEQAGTITHHVDGSLFPEDLGKDFRRSFTVDGDVFTLSFTNSSPSEPAVTRTLRFRRLK